MADTDFKISFGPDPESVNRFATLITNAFTEAFKSAKFQGFFREFDETFANTTKKSGKNSTQIRQDFRGLSEGIRGSVKDAVNAMREFTKNSQATEATILKQFNLITEKMVRDSVERNRVFDRTAQDEIEAAKRGGSQAAIEAQRSAQLQVVNARNAGKQRIQITRAFLETIARLEKGAGVAIQGIARTAVSGVSKIFAGLGSVVHRSNTQFTQGLSSSLKTRESTIRSSFTRQEQTISRSAQRQAAQLAKLRTETQRGVLGSVNRLGLSSFIGGFAAIGAIRSTFNVGGEFVRGLAVLQTQLDLTGEQMKSVRALSIQLGNDITLPGVSALDAAQAIQILAKQFGYLGPAAIDAAQAAAKGTLQLARAVGASAEDTAGIIGAAVNVFKIGAEDAVFVADQVAGAISKAAGVSFQDFAESFKAGASTFASFETPVIGAKDALLEFNTALAQLAKGGLVGEQAGTGLKQFLIQATDGSKRTQEQLLGIAKAAGVTGTVFFDESHNARRFSDSLDILRKGLAGMSQEQRLTTLTQIFGARATQIANNLLSVSTEEYGKLRDSISRQGLAAQIAAAQNTGFKGAMDALKSVIETVQIVFYEKINPALGRFTLLVASAANAIFFGEGAWTLLRQALLGAAIGMGAILAAKGAVEVIQLLGNAAKLALTPFGALIVTASVVGGLFFVLWKRSKEFREALTSVGKEVRTFASDILGALKKGFNEVVDAFNLDELFKKVSNTANDAAGESESVFKRVADAIKNGLASASKFLTEKVIPALTRGVIFIGKVVIPAIGDAIGFIGDRIADVVRIVGDFFSNIRPYVQPAIDGFKALGEAIGAAFAGDFSKLGAGAGAALGGIGGALKNIGKAIVDALTPAAIKVRDFFKDLFSGPNLKKYALGFLAFVEEVGRIIGSIISSPAFIKAVAAIAAAAAVIAFKFIEGFARGVVQNLPKLVNLIGDVLSAGLEAAFSNIVPVLIGALAIASLGPALFRRFRGVGEQAAGGFSAGFVSRSKGFLSGALFGPGSLNASGVKKQALTQIRDIQNSLRTLGSTQVFNLKTFQGLKDANKEVKRLQIGLTESQIAGLKFRDTVKNVAAGIMGIARGLDFGFRGLGQVLTAPVRALKDSLTPTAGASIGSTFAKSFVKNVSTGWTEMKVGFSSAWDSLKVAAARSGVSVGTALGRSIGSAAMIGISAIVGGKAAGEAGGSGLFAALTAGVTGLALGGPLIGAASAGVSLIATAFGRAEGAAKRFKEQVKGLTDSFKGPLVEAIESGIIKLGEFGTNLDFRAIISLEGNTDSVVKAISAALPADVKAALDAVGINIGRDVVLTLQAVNGDVDKFRTKFSQAFIGASTASEEFKNKFGTNASQVRELLDEIAKPDGKATIADWINDASNWTPLKRNFAELIQNNKTYLQGILTANDAIGNQAEAIAKAAREAEIAARLEANLPPIGGGRVGSPSVRGAIIDPGEEARAFRLASALLRAGESIDVVNEKLKTKYSLPQVDTKPWEASMKDAAAKTGILQDALDEAKSKWDELFFVPGDTSIQESIDQAVVSVAGFTPAIKEAMKEGGVQGEAQIRILMRDLGTNIESVLKKGVEDGVVVDEATARFITQGVFDAAVAGLPKDSQAYKNAATAYENALSNVTPTLNTVNAAAAAVAFQQQVEAYLAANPLTTTVNAVAAVTIAVSGDELRGDAAGRRELDRLISEAIPDALAIPAPEIDTGAIQTSAKSAMDQMSADTAEHWLKVRPTLKSPTADKYGPDGTVTAGRAIDDGVMTGLNDRAPALYAKARSIANNIAAIFRNALKIASPSKVFQGIGQSIVDGLALGIEGGVGKVTDAMSAITDTVTGVDINVPKITASDIALPKITAADVTIPTITTANIVLPTVTAPEGFTANPTRAGNAVPTPSPQLTAADIDMLIARIAETMKPDVNIEQTFNEKVDSRAIATDVAWRLT